MAESKKVANFMLDLEQLLHKHGVDRKLVLWLASSPDYDPNNPLAAVARYFGAESHALHKTVLEDVLEPFPFLFYPDQPAPDLTLQERLPTPAPHVPEEIDMDL